MTAANLTDERIAEATERLEKQAKKWRASLAPREVQHGIDVDTLLEGRRILAASYARLLRKIAAAQPEPVKCCSCGEPIDYPQCDDCEHWLHVEP